MTQYCTIHNIHPHQTKDTTLSNGNININININGNGNNVNITGNYLPDRAASSSMKGLDLLSFLFLSFLGTSEDGLLMQTFACRSLQPAGG
jgi:hypothetical protein